MRAMSRLGLVLASLFALVAGCSPEARDGDEKSTEASRTTSSNDREGGTSEGSAGSVGDTERVSANESEEIAAAFVSVDSEGLAAEIRSYGDRIVLVDCWATWCLHCLEQMPRTIEWEREYRDDGLTVLSLNFDSPDDEARRALAGQMLDDLGATFPRLQSSLSGTAAMDAFEIDAGLPHYRLYVSGELRATFDESGPELEQALRTALDERRARSSPRR